MNESLMDTPWNIEVCRDLLVAPFLVIAVDVCGGIAV